MSYTGPPPCCLAAAAPTFSVNGSNAAKSTMVTFYAVGTYDFMATITDTVGQSVTSSVPITVSPTYTSIVVSPSTVTLNSLGTQQFTAVAEGRFGEVLTSPPAITWTASAGTITPAGLLTASAFSGSYTVTASSGTVQTARA